MFDGPAAPEATAPVLTAIARAILRNALSALDGRLEANAIAETLGRPVILRWGREGRPRRRERTSWL
jgi:hypothetical protein